MKKIIVAVIALTAIISHVYSAEFECTWNEYKGPLYSMVPGQKPHITGQAWPLMHKTITADNEEQALEQCQMQVLPTLEELQAFWLQKSTRNWNITSNEVVAKKSEQATTQQSEWHCQGGTTNVPLKIVAANEDEANAKCQLMSAGGEQLKAKKLS